MTFPINTSEALHPHCEDCHSKLYMVKENPCGCMIVGCDRWDQEWQCCGCGQKWERIDWG